MATLVGESVIFSFVVLFGEDAFNYVLQRASSLHNRMATRTQISTLSRKRIMPKICVYLPWIKVQRVYIMWPGFSGRSSECDANELCKTLYLCSDSQIEEDQATPPWERKIEDLEKEMLDLRSEVTKLLLLQESKISVTAQERPNLNSESEVSSSTSEVLAPRPPPPPPPLPPTPLAPNRLTLVRVKVKAEALSVPPATCSIMEELAKRPPKLRHVERSPGGRPVRTPLESNDPADKLAAILRKRFEAIHSPARDPYMISPRSSPKSPELFGH